MVTDLEEGQSAPKCLQRELIPTAESRMAGIGGFSHRQGEVR